jgi:phosphate starvation-inducible PhoH-like protein
MTRRKEQPSIEDLGRPDVKPIEGKTETQKRYINAIKNFKLIFATGSAGTGKTWLATALAAQALLNDRTEGIILTRPAVEAGESLGFLPGEIEEKFEPYLQPFKQVLYERLGKGKAEYMIKAGKIKAIPLAYLRGMTFRNCFVILDEAQNTSPTQMKMFLTRIGENCTVVVNGDTSQQDIRGESGLTDAIERLSYIPSVKIIEFKKEDIVRSGLVQEIVEAYEQPKKDDRPLKEYKRFYERKEYPATPYIPNISPNPYDPPLGGWTCEAIAKETIKKEVKTAEDRLNDSESPFSRFFQNHIKNLSL